MVDILWYPIISSLVPSHESNPICVTHMQSCFPYVYRNGGGRSAWI